MLLMFMTAPRIKETPHLYHQDSADIIMCQVPKILLIVLPKCNSAIRPVPTTTTSCFVLALLSVEEHIAMET